MKDKKLHIIAGLVVALAVALPVMKGGRE